MIQIHIQSLNGFVCQIFAHMNINETKQNKITPTPRVNARMMQAAFYTYINIYLERLCGLYRWIKQNISLWYSQEMEREKEVAGWRWLHVGWISIHEDKSGKHGDIILFPFSSLSWKFTFCFAMSLSLFVCVFVWNESKTSGGDKVASGFSLLLFFFFRGERKTKTISRFSVGAFPCQTIPDAPPSNTETSSSNWIG